jgi:hypothetical protein
MDEKRRFGRGKVRIQGPSWFKSSRVEGSERKLAEVWRIWGIRRASDAVER